MAVNNFDFIAPFYDGLSKLVFGDALLTAQRAHISEIKEKDNVLILGGGTGKVLRHIPLCKSIDYVEKSRRMIRMAKKRLVNRPINFIDEDFLSFQTEKKYDVIICPFFLDCFNEETLKEVIIKIKSLLTPDGKLIVSEFDQKRVNKRLLRAMLIFFKLFAQLGTDKLLDIRFILQREDFQEDEIASFGKGIFSGLYSPVSRMKR